MTDVYGVSWWTLIIMAMVTTLSIYQSDLLCFSCCLHLHWLQATWALQHCKKPSLAENISNTGFKGRKDCCTIICLRYKFCCWCCPCLSLHTLLFGHLILSCNNSFKQKKKKKLLELIEAAIRMIKAQKIFRF